MSAEDKPKTDTGRIPEDYFRALFEAGRRGDAREESFYGPLAALTEAMAGLHDKNGLHVTTLPKQTEAGNPDFRVWDGRARITGYIEAKKPGINLDQVETSDQLKRYLHTFPNVILTDFYEFRLYRDGRRLERVVAGQSFVPGTLKAPSPARDAAGLADLFGKFFSFSLPRRFTARTLAVELAKRTRFLRDEVVALELREQEKQGKGDILGFYHAFKEYLIADLSLEQFADLYAQTVTYGMFAARTRTKTVPAASAAQAGGFDRRSAFDRIPRTIGLLRDLFQYISYGQLPEPLAWMTDDIAEVLAAADVRKLLDQFYRDGKGRDPIVHFYETFLAEYDPKERERRGVYYTPEPVVGYIVRSVHALVKERFNKPDGLASEGVTLLDPAAGTMTFVAEAARVAAEEYEGKYGDGSKAEFVRDHILANFYAFELMMAPYTVGHLKMSFLLEELGYALGDDDRFKLYLTNTLEFEDLEQSDLPGMRSLSEESHLAGKVKKEQPILVVLGNPPYSGHSFNTGDWIRGLIDDYKQVDGQPLGERNPKWLQDDYVKFLRFAQWKIDQAGEGIVAMITNHGYLDNPTFRGMRRSLMNTFDEIHVLNLHGNSLKKETAPDGGEDKNVFDIRQGVAICVMVKVGRASPKRRPAPTQSTGKAEGLAFGEGGPTVRHADLWGPRKGKYDWLDAHQVGTTGWTDLAPSSPAYLFIPRDETAARRYEAWQSLPEVFPVNSVGIVTARDHFVIDMDLKALKRRIETFRNADFSDELVGQMLGLKNSGAWKLSKARRAFLADAEWERRLTRILYRPFDTREFCYHGELIERGREEVMAHMLEPNLCIVSPKQNKDECGALACETLGGHKAVAAYDINYYFPLYIYPGKTRDDLFTLASGGERVPNFPDWLLPRLNGAYGGTGSTPSITPEDVFHYIYAVLYSPPYRERYNEFLKSDFPRIPFAADAKAFRAMAELGAELVALHLLKSPKLDTPVTKFRVPGDNRVAKNKAGGRRYDADARRVYINREQYFDNITEELWAYRIGGYQVLDKWLKDRAERRLSPAEVKHYCRTATALAETIKLQRRLVEAYDAAEERTIAPDEAHPQPEAGSDLSERL